MRQSFQKHFRVSFLLCVGVIVVCYRTFFYTTHTLDSFRIYQDLVYEEVDENQACKLPRLHPFESEVMGYFKPAKPLNCKSSSPILTYIDGNGFLRFNATAFKESGYTTDTLSCYYQEIDRDGDRDDSVIYSEHKLMTGFDAITSDFVYVACSSNSWFPNVYSMYHAHVQKSENIRQFYDNEELGVIVIGLDSVSRLNFMRQLPRTLDTIETKMGGIVLQGFNKVGDNTLFNIVPILTGSPPGDTTYSFQFDRWPFLWNPLNADNVATFYGEDLSKISTFSWWGAGFKTSPTTHYFHPFWVAADQSALSSWSSTMCLGSIPKHIIYINYLRSFLRAYKNSPMFMFSLENEPSHDFINTVGVIDGDLNKFLLESFEDGLFNRSILFILADHGNRMDTFRQTQQGKIEDSMPMVSVILPPWLIAKRPDVYEVLKSNKNRLTSSYDLYSTFVDVFQRTTFKKALSKRHNFEKPKYGQSLFNPVSPKRTCKDAGIPEMYCACTEETRILADNDELVENSINIIMSFINDEVLNKDSKIWKTALSNYQQEATLDTIDQCSLLILEDIEDARLVLKVDGRQLVHLKFSTRPNDGLYEARVEWTGLIGKIHEDILRINRYGSQPDCLERQHLIMMPFLRYVCYCN